MARPPCSTTSRSKHRPHSDTESFGAECSDATSEGVERLGPTGASHRQAPFDRVRATLVRRPRRRSYGPRRTIVDAGPELVGAASRGASVTKPAGRIGGLKSIVLVEDEPGACTRGPPRPTPWANHGGGGGGCDQRREPLESAPTERWSTPEMLIRTIAREMPSPRADDLERPRTQRDGRAGPADLRQRNVDPRRSWSGPARRAQLRHPWRVDSSYRREAAEHEGPVRRIPVPCAPRTAGAECLPECP